MTALVTLLRDPAQTISYVAVITYRDPDADTTTTITVTDRKRARTDSVDHQGLLVDPGRRTAGAEVDELGESLGSAAGFGPVVFANVPPSPGGAAPFDQYSAYVFSGQPIVIKAGDPAAALSTYEEVASGVIQNQPQYDREAGTWTLQRKSTISLVNRDLDVKQYVGEPYAVRPLTSTGVATTAYNAAHDLTEFTVCGRFSHPGVGTNFSALSRKQITSSSRNWTVFLFPSSSGDAGEISASCSSGGVANQISLQSGDRYDDGVEHWIAFVVGPTHAYLMVDDEVVAEDTSPATPDTPATGIDLGSRFDDGPAWFNDIRILDHYTTPDEARAWMSVRATGDEDGLVGLWRGDDNTGGTITDYSPTGVNASIAGVENTDYEWTYSGLGDSGLAGRSMSAVLGWVWNAAADIVDATREVWRMIDRAITVTGTWTVRDQGEDLTGGGTDYTVADDQYAELVAEAGEPLTVGFEPTTESDGFPSDVLTELLVARGPLASADVDSGALHRVDMVYPFGCGIWTRRAPVSELLVEFTRGIGGFVTQDLDGTLRVDTVRPPVSPGPRGGDQATVEFLAETDTAINFGDVGVYPIGTGGAFTCAGWIRTQRLSKNVREESILGTTIQEVIVDKTGLGGGVLGDYGFGTSGYNGKGLVLWAASNTVSVKTLDIPVLRRSSPGTWQFVAGVNDTSAGNVKFYWAPNASTAPILVGTVTGALTPDEDSAEDTVIGSPHNLGGLSEVSVWKKALSLAELTTIHATQPVGNETDLIFFAPLDDRKGSPSEKVGGGTGTMTGCAWRPDMTVDLTRTPRPWRSRDLRPAWRIESQYRTNFAPLSTEQIVAAVDADARERLKGESQSIEFNQPGILDDYPDAVEKVVRSPFLERWPARNVLRHLTYRYGAGREVASLENAPREAILARPGLTEVRVVGHQELSSGRTYRVVQVAAQPDPITARLGLWR